MHSPIDMMAIKTAFGTQVVEHWLEREIAQWVNISLVPTRSKIVFNDINYIMLPVSSYFKGALSRNCRTLIL